MLRRRDEQCSRGESALPSASVTPRTQTGWLARRLGALSFALTVITATASLGCVVTPRGRRSGQTFVPRVSSLPPVDQWVDVSPQGSGLTARFPGAPDISERQRTDFDGATIDLTLGRLTRFPVAYFGFVVIQADGGLVGDLSETLNELRRDQAQTTGAEHLRESRSFEHAGYPITEAVIELREMNAVLYLRTYVGRSRLYSVFCAVPAQNEHQGYEAVRTYFESVRLEPGDAPSPSGNGRFDDDGWGYVYPPETDFAASMPGGARGTDGQTTLGDETLPMRTYTIVADGGGRFEVRVLSFVGRPPAGTIDKARDLFANGAFEVDSETPVHVQGFAGRRVLYHSSDSSAEVRFFVTARRLYEVRVELPDGSSNELQVARDRFLRSFRIL